ncbi:MAG: hypothetical protein ABI400_12295 [Lacisediminihabitans sp.]
MTDTTPEAIPSNAPKRTSEARSLQNWAIVLSSLVVPVPILFSRLIEAILKSSNPAHVDVRQGLAYLSEQLAWGFGSLGLLLLLLIVIYVIIYRRAKTLDALKVPLLIFALQAVLGIVILLAGGVIDSAVSNYSS